MDFTEKNQQVMRLKEAYLDLYEAYGGGNESFTSLMGVMKDRYDHRNKELKLKDEANHNWYMSEKMIGMMLYVDLFAQDFNGLIKRIPYLKELGITYVHLMPLLKPREGENDGGYAVEDYKNVNSVLGDLSEFVDVIEALRKEGIAVCIDYVFNHTSDSHEWAIKALKGEKKYQAMYEMYDTREIPDQYDAHIPEVLPDKHPGNFTYVEAIDQWVFTSFSDFQWDLNFKNPYVFERMVDIMLYLANLGISILRLDAIAFIWKELGTSCRNLPGAHDLMHLLYLIKEMVCPSLELLGEAIVEPDEIFKYFGTEDKVECGILYNANFMVNIFNALATRDVRLMRIDNSRFQVPSTGCFMNYVRCHDDIGWGFNEDATRQLGMDPYWHKQFLINFYSDNFQDSFSKGEVYQYNHRNKDARINGTLASLLGLEKAEDEYDHFGRSYAINRIKLVNALIFSHRGIPLIYSGDELATLNDHSYLEDPSKKKEGRWVHRPYFDWDRANKRTDLKSDEGVMFQYMKRLIELRKAEPLFSGEIDALVIDMANRHVYAFRKESPDDRVLCLYNFSEHEQKIDSGIFRAYGYAGKVTDLMEGRQIDLNQEQVKLYPYECLWLK